MSVWRRERRSIDTMYRGTGQRAGSYRPGLPVPCSPYAGPRWLVAALCALLLLPLARPCRCDSGLYDTAMHRVRSLSNSPNVRLLPFGRSAEGRVVTAFVISDFAVRSTHKARILVCAGQHGDEANPVKALLSLCGKLASGAQPEILARCVIIAIPMVNPDGVVRDTRLNAQGIDVNRDWFRLETPEAKYMDSIIRTWRPHTLLDLHEWNETPTIPGDEVEVAPCAREDQWNAMASLAARMARSSGLSVVQCKPRGTADLFHRRYSSLGYAAFLVETRPHIPYAAKAAAYSAAVVTAAKTVAARKQREVLSPATDTFCMSLVSPYLEPLRDTPAPSARIGGLAPVLGVVYLLLMWLAKPFAKHQASGWSRRLRRCAVGAEVSTDPLVLRRGPYPLTSRSWINRRLRSRYAASRPTPAA